MPNITQELADILTNVGVNAAYGAPVELNGTTIMPVAMTCYGFGAGEQDQDDGGDTAGSGGGGGGTCIPVGAYVTRDGTARFEPNTVALLAVGIPFMFVTGRALARVVKALKG